jgi:hypothetical protein
VVALLAHTRRAVLVLPRRTLLADAALALLALAGHRLAFAYSSASLSRFLLGSGLNSHDYLGEPQHLLYFLPLPQGHGAFLITPSLRTTVAAGF